MTDVVFMAATTPPAIPPARRQPHSPRPLRRNRPERAAEIIAAFDLSENKGKGVITVDGRMVEIMHGEMARRTGLPRTSSSASGLRFCGIMLLPVVKPSPNRTNPNSLDP